MVVLPQTQTAISDDSANFETCKSASTIFTEIPVVDFSDAINAKKLVVDACKEFGFFKVINHGISMELVATLESEAVNFFSLPQQEKDTSGSPSPFGYGNRRIGPNGDTGWVEYLLLSTRPDPMLLPAISPTLSVVADEYASSVRNIVSRVLAMISDELEIEPGDYLSGLVGDEKSDSCLRLNHYPPCPDLRALSGQSLIGFGEHTDPQIMSVMRSSSEVPGFEIRLRDGTWVSVPPDQTSLYFNVGDALQVMSNGRFRSVKHRVVANCLKSRVSMVYFAGPPLSEKIKRLSSSLMEEGEESLYEEFTWSKYKMSAYNSKLGDDRLKHFEKSM